MSLNCAACISDETKRYPGETEEQLRAHFVPELNRSPPRPSSNPPIPCQPPPPLPQTLRRAHCTPLRLQVRLHPPPPPAPPSPPSSPLLFRCLSIREVHADRIGQLVTLRAMVPPPPNSFASFERRFLCKCLAAAAAPPSRPQANYELTPPAGYALKRRQAARARHHVQLRHVRV